ncbi:MAG: hsp70 family protein [Desulfobacterales bacterium]|nr:hsp70 family protein [Desulfobacterales bacterium]
MELFDKHYIIGIDLGTTNCAVSYVELDVDERENKKQKQTDTTIKLFKVPQLTGPGEVTHQPILPSFLYIPGKYDIKEEHVRLPWNTEDTHVVGQFARDHGSKIPNRLVSSAKSWLCHHKADRYANILPWGSDASVQKVSPIQATAGYLRHMRYAWNYSKGQQEELYMENQFIVITVPASFDEVARDMTIEAATQAGLKHITLLEEPLAAFYSWLITHEQQWDKYVKPGELILVCDIGGGTTDFTLITLRMVDGHPRFERIAVGDHLILGGDNIDLTIARFVEAQFGKKGKLIKGDRWKTLCHQCRQVKEHLLTKEGDSEVITLVGEGGNLIGGTASYRMTRQDLEHIVLEGFFPIVSSDIPKKDKSRKGISEFGLPYEQEPAITKQLGWFLEQHKTDVTSILNKESVPDLILFNGGSIKPDVVQDRIRDGIAHWFKNTFPEYQGPRVLANPEPDLAVAKGAAYYGLVKMGKGVRVGSGSARSYYLAIGNKETQKEQQHQETNSTRVMCIIERGLEENTPISIENQQFEVLANQPVSFDLYSSSYRSGDRCGDIFDIDDTLTRLPPLQTVIKFGEKGVKTAIPVKLEGLYTEVGALSLRCCSQITNHKWQLRFQLRDIKNSINIVSDQEIFEDSLIEEIQEVIRNAFASTKAKQTDKQDLNTITKDVTRIIKRSKEKWPLGLIRQMVDELMLHHDTRRLTSDYEIRWLNLMGYCLRPGFGDNMDAYRVENVWKLYRKGMYFNNNPQVHSEWWIMWRRICAGLKPGQQKQIFQDIMSMIGPKSQSRIPSQEKIELWMILANLEQLSIKDKLYCANLLLPEIRPKKVKHQLLWVLSRLGARELLYGPIDKVIPPSHIESWINLLITQDWSNPKLVANALTQLARKTGDTARDIDDEYCLRIITWMESNTYSTGCFTEVIPLKEEEDVNAFGEDLPIGLLIRHSQS